MVVGETAPAISGLTYIKGQPVAIGKDDGIKKVVVLEIWATWCPPCRDAFPHLTQLQKQYADQHVYVVGVTSEDDRSKIERFVSGQGSSMDYVVAMDTGGEVEGLMAKARVQGIPHAFIIDVHNKIVYSGHPRDPGFDSALKLAAAQAGERRTKQALPLITDSYDELMGKSIKELKTILQDRGVSLAGLAEKSDLARKIEETCRSVTYYK